MKTLKILGFFVGLATSYIVYKVGRIYVIRAKYKHIPGPKTNGIIGHLFGNTADILQLRKEGKIFVDFLSECHEKYGPVFKYQFIDRISVFTSNPEAVKETLITKDFPKPIEFLTFFTYLLGERFVGIGLSTDPDYERWKKRRAIFNHGFQRNLLMTFVNQFNSKADILMEKLRGHADGKQTVELAAEFNHATLDAIALIAFGLNIDSINNDSEMSKAIAASFKTLAEVLADPLLKLRPSKRKQLKDTREYIRYMRKTARDIIDNRLEALKNKEYVPTDILSNILSNWKDENIDIEAMIDDFVTFFIAGQETTANTLAFCFLELGKNPEVLQKTKEEVDRVIGNKNEIGYQDAIELKYCSCVFKEALRLYPPSPLLLRCATNEMNINGYYVPSGTMISVSSYVSARHENYFKNPKEFRPERFMKDADTMESSIENYTYFPFSLGPRNCIGQNFANIEGIIMIAKFLQKLDFKLDPNQSFNIADASTLKPQDGTRCILNLRS